MKNIAKNVKTTHVSSNKAFKLSRSRLELFINCKRCFYLDTKLGIKRPDGFPFTLNKAIDTLLKKEFDLYRAAQKPHPILIKNSIYAIPFVHEKLDVWRNWRQGIRYMLPNINVDFGGAIDDVWIDLQTQELIIVDYKATSKAGMVTLDEPWQIVYKRQIEIYQWLFRKNGFDVADTAYFVYCNGKKDGDFFNSQLNFDISLVPYVVQGKCEWVEHELLSAYECLKSDNIPQIKAGCKHCLYVAKVENQLSKCIRAI